MSRNDSDRRNPLMTSKHPVITNLLVILAVAVLGLLIVYLSIAIFTKHGQTDVVPGVENMSYTEAVKKLHDAGFRTDIRDSVFVDNVRPGYVIEQFPRRGSIVKPGRKIFLYINAVHPKEVIVDDDAMHPAQDALRGYSRRQGMAKLKELGFKDVRVVYVLGDNDCIVKVTANGRTVKKMQKVPVNAKMVIEVYDNRLTELRDSLQNEELLRIAEETGNYYSGSGSTEPYYEAEEDPEPYYRPETPSRQTEHEEVESSPEYYE